MLSIVSHHYVVNSGLVGGVISDEHCSPNSLFYWLFGMWGKTGINCFVLITGYFMCASRITLRKFLKLILQVEFYKVVISSLFLAFQYDGFTMKDCLLQLLPIKMVSDGFTSCFILFWLTIPFLNRLIQGMDKKMHQRLIGLCLFIYTFVLYLPHGGVVMNYVSWFIVLYFISSYIRLYPESIYKSDSTKTWGWLSILSTGMAMGSVVMTCWIDDTFGKNKPPYWLVSDSNAILALLAGVSTFMFFKNLKMPHSKIINGIGATTFGVLLIHANSDTMRQWLWRDIVDCVGHYDTEYYYLYAPAAILGIFMVCSLIDFIRIHTIEKWFFNQYGEKIERIENKWLKNH